MQKKKFTARTTDGRTFIVHAKNEGEALRFLLVQHRVNRFKFLTTEDVNPEFVIQVGKRDYTCVAPNAVTALTAFAKMGLDMNKARNLRKR